MPIEIRELIIRTEVKTNDVNYQEDIDKESIISLKRALLEECTRIIVREKKRGAHKR